MENQLDSTSQIGGSVFIGHVDRRSVVDHRAGGRCHQSGDNIRQSRFAATGLADQAERCAVMQLKRHVIDRQFLITGVEQGIDGPSLGIAVRQMVDFQQGLCCGLLRRVGFFRGSRVDARDCRGEHFPVVRSRRRENLRCLAPLDDFAVEHDQDIFAHVIGQGQVVGNIDQRRSHALTQFLDQFQDLHFRGRIKSRCRFIEDQKSRLTSQGSGDNHALALAARIFVWITAVDILRFW